MMTSGSVFVPALWGLRERHTGRVPVVRINQGTDVDPRQPFAAFQLRDALLKFTGAGFVRSPRISGAFAENPEPREHCREHNPEEAQSGSDNRDPIFWGHDPARRFAIAKITSR